MAHRTATDKHWGGNQPIGSAMELDQSGSAFGTAGWHLLEIC
jgi:hypothetical protein